MCEAERDIVSIIADKCQHLENNSDDANYVEIVSNEIRELSLQLLNYKFAFEYQNAKEREDFLNDHMK